MDRTYVLAVLDARIKTLKNRYRMACHGKDDNGEFRGTFEMTNTRHAALRDLNLCLLIEELVFQIKRPLVEFSEEASDGFDKLVTPIERHRRLKNRRTE